VEKETDAAWDATVQVCAVHATELEEQGEGGLEEEEESKRRLEEENERRMNEEEEMEFVKQVRTETTGDNTSRRQSVAFNWATDVDELPGPIPTFVDHAPAERASCTPTCTHITSTNPVPIPVPATFTGTSSIVPVLSTPSIVHGPRDFSALRSDMRNPWGSLNHHRH